MKIHSAKIGGVFDTQIARGGLILKLRIITFKNENENWKLEIVIYPGMGIEFYSGQFIFGLEWSMEY